MNTFESIRNMIDAIRDEYQSRDVSYTSSDSAAYALGYISSILNGVICEMPKTKQKKILEQFENLTNQKLSQIQ